MTTETISQNEEKIPFQESSVRSAAHPQLETLTFHMEEQQSGGSCLDQNHTSTVFASKIIPYLSFNVYFLTQVNVIVV